MNTFRRSEVRNSLRSNPVFTGNGRNWSPRYRLHKASGQALVELSGRTIYLGPHGTKTSRRAYDLAVAEWLARQRSPLPAESPGGFSVTELIAAFWRHAPTYYRKADGTPTGEIAPLKTALRMLRQAYGDLQVAQFGPLKLQAVRERMIVAGWSRKNINAQVRRLIRVFRRVVSRELVPSQVPVALREVPGLERGRTEARESADVRPVSDEVFQATLPHLPQVVADLLRLMRRTGMRPDEACSIRPGDIDRSADVWLYRPRSHKTERHGITRSIAIGPAGQQVLTPYLLRGADEFCFTPAESEAKRRADRHTRRRTPLGYGNRPGSNVVKRRSKPFRERYDATGLRKAIERACELAFAMPEELRRISRSATPAERAALQTRARAWRQLHCWAPNRLRHSFGTEIRRAHGLEGAQVMLGHREADVTQIYAERDEKRAIEIAREVG